MSDPTPKQIEEMIEKVAMELSVFCVSKKMSSLRCEFRLMIEDHSETHPALFDYNSVDGAKIQMVWTKKL